MKTTILFQFIFVHLSIKLSLSPSTFFLFNFIFKLDLLSPIYYGNKPNELRKSLTFRFEMIEITANNNLTVRTVISTPVEYSACFFSYGAYITHTRHGCKCACAMCIRATVSRFVFHYRCVYLCSLITTVSFFFLS